MPSLIAGFFPTLRQHDQRKGGLETGDSFSADQALLLPELVETILPETDTPGAKKAMVHVFVDLYVKDCYPKEQQTLFLQGLDDLGVHHSFLSLEKPAQLSLLKELETTERAQHLAEEKSFIKMLKNLTVLGYFTSQIGAEQAAEYIMTPGPFVGCIDMKPGQKVSAL